MAWNEPGNGKDPWERGDEKPTNLDDIVLGWQRRLAKLLGGEGGGGGGRPGGGSAAGAFILVILLLAAWVVTGFYRVDEAERGIVQRFGAYTETTLPGLHWHLPYPIESVTKVDVTKVYTVPLRATRVGSSVSRSISSGSPRIRLPPPHIVMPD